MRPWPNRLEIGSATSATLLATDKALETLLGHIKLMRPFAWVWFDGFPAAALFALITGGFSTATLTAIFVLILIDSAATTLNDVFDIATDRVSKEANRNQRPIVAGIVSPRAAILQSVSLNLAALALAIVHGGWMIAATLLAILWGTIYSLPPFRLSARPQFSNAFWFFCGSVFYLVVASAANALFSTASVFWLLGYFGFYATGENLAKDLRDWENDTLAQKQTLVVKVGPRRAALHSYIGCWIGTAFYFLLVWTNPGIAFPFRIVLSGILVAWLVIAGNISLGIYQEYSKALARDLHLGYIRAYLLFNLAIAANYALTVWKK